MVVVVVMMAHFEYQYDVYLEEGGFFLENILLLLVRRRDNEKDGCDKSRGLRMRDISHHHRSSSSIYSHIPLEFTPTTSSLSLLSAFQNNNDNIL